MNLEYGATYYQVSYADPKLTMPGLKPMVYVGENIFGDEGEPVYYFQDTVSVLIFGRIGEATETTDCHVSSFPKDELGTCIVDIDEAAKLVVNAAAKCKKLDYPKLEKAPGDWKPE